MMTFPMYGKSFKKTCSKPPTSICWDHTMDGRNPAPADRWFITLFIVVQPSKVVQDFFHSQYIYIYIEYIICVCTGIMEYIDMLVKDNPYQNHIYILMEYDVKSINNNNK